MPNYIAGGLAEFAPPPYSFTNFGNVTFILDALDSRLKAVCDTFLNAPLGRSSADAFIPGADNRIIVVCSTFPVAAAGPMQPFGYSVYSEIAVMFSVFDQKNARWSWYVPVLYLDGPKANPEEWQAELPIAAGRELFGLAKARAEIDIDPVLHTGTVKPIDPAAQGQPIKVSQAIEISVNACTVPSAADELAVCETELFGVEIEMDRAENRGELDEEARDQFRKQIQKLKDQVKVLRASRDKATRRRQRTIDELIRLDRQPEARQILAPKDLIRMLWGGDPYRNVGRDSPPQATLLQNLGFIGAGGGPDGLRAPLEGTGSVTPPPKVQFQFDFRLLGLRQFRDPVTPNQATIQEVIRTQFKFDRLPWSPMQTFCVKIEDPLATALGVGKYQTCPADRVYVYSNANASFGLAEIVT
jgi:hypothetical protein